MRMRPRSTPARTIDMPNIAALLKDEIACIARKEVRTQTEDVR
jgi:hypothetical protein